MLDKNRYYFVTNNIPYALPHHLHTVNRYEHEIHSGKCLRVTRRNGEKALTGSDLAVVALAVEPREGKRRRKKYYTNHRWS